MERVAAVLRHIDPSAESSGVRASCVHGVEHLANVPTAPPDSILGLNASFRADTSPDKLNLGVGAYRTEAGAPYVLNVVRKVEQEILDDKSVNKEYLPIDGLKQFTSGAARVILGADSPAVREGRVISVQSLGGTGALRLGADFLYRFYGKTIYIPSPTWGNHKQVFTRAGHEVRQYRYYDDSTRGLDFRGFLADVKAAPKGSIFLLHACAHNPTGVDPSVAQWATLADVFAEREHFAFFDSAYQGFATGDLEADAGAVRQFVARGIEMVIAQSFSKNLGFYGERVGCFHVVSSTKEVTESVSSQVKKIVRAMYSNPPIHGALIAARIFSDEQKYAEWVEELKGMSARLLEMRSCLHAELLRIQCPGNWSHVLEQIGMFTFLGISPSQVKQLTDKHHVYLTGNGRISVAGLSRRTVPYFAAALKDVIVNVR